MGRSAVSITFVLLAFLLVMPAFAGQIYKWRDEQGRLHFSDTPRDDNSQLLKETTEPPPPAARVVENPAAKDNMAPPAEAEVEPENIVRIPYVSQEGYANRVIVRIRFNNRVTAPILVDTGAPGMVISVNLAEKLRLFDKEGSQLLAIVSGIGGAEYATRTIIDSIALGNITEEDVPAHIVSGMSGAYEGLIGMDILSGYTLTIDPINEQLVAREIPESPDHPGGHSKKWWQGMFRELKMYQEYWDHHAELVDQSGNAYARMLPPERERYKTFILHQQDEAKHLYRKFLFKANRYHVPVYWR